MADGPWPALLGLPRPDNVLLPYIPILETISESALMIAHKPSWDNAEKTNNLFHKY